MSTKYDFDAPEIKEVEDDAFMIVKNIIDDGYYRTHEDNWIFERIYEAIKDQKELSFLLTTMLKLISETEKGKEPDLLVNQLIANDNEKIKNALRFIYQLAGEGKKHIRQWKDQLEEDLVLEVAISLVENSKTQSLKQEHLDYDYQ